MYLNVLVGKERLELSILSAHAPQACAYTVPPLAQFISWLDSYSLGQASFEHHSTFVEVQHMVLPFQVT